MTILSYCKIYIHSRVEKNDINFSRYMTCVYGDPDANLRKIVWENITNFRIPHNQAWLCCGDFNDILAQNEKDGLRARDSRSIETFRNFLDNNNLIDMELKGCRFTWSNNRDVGLVSEKNDMMFCNSPWNFKFPNASLTALPAVGSDHSPLILQLHRRHVEKRRLFHYEDFWEDHADLPRVIKYEWGSPLSSSITEKIKRISRGREDWSKYTFKKATIEIAKTKKEAYDA